MPRDEYAAYAPQIASRLREGATPEEIATFLGEIRTARIGLPPHPDADQAVARKIRDWYQHPFFGTEYPSAVGLES